MGGGEGVIARGEGECWIEYRVQSTEYGKMAVQRCKSAYGLCKGGKVDDKTGRVGTAYRPSGI